MVINDEITKYTLTDGDFVVFVEHDVVGGEVAMNNSFLLV